MEPPTETIINVLPEEQTDQTVEAVVEEKEVECIGKYTGQCKWFNDKLGYGFVTVCNGEDKGKDIFVHHSGIKPLNSNYKTLRKGEYIQFNVVDGMNGLQAVDVRGIGGGPLMCDFVSTRKPTISSAVGGTHHVYPYPPPGYVSGSVPQWKVVGNKKSKYEPKSHGRANDVQTKPGRKSYRQVTVGEKPGRSV